MLIHLSSLVTLRAKFANNTFMFKKSFYNRIELHKDQKYLRVGMFNYWKQVHDVIFSKRWVFPTFKVIFPQQDLHTC